jgi:hypothetical protein
MARLPRIGDIVWYGKPGANAVNTPLAGLFGASPLKPPPMAVPAVVMKVHDPSNAKLPLDLIVFGFEPIDWLRTEVLYSPSLADEAWSWPEPPAA